MLEFFFTGIVVAISCLFLLMKFDIKKVLWVDWLVDIIFTVFLAILMAGTYSGMIAALMGGMFLSMALFVLKRIIGYRRPTVWQIQTAGKYWRPVVVWIEETGKWQK